MRCRRFTSVAFVSVLLLGGAVSWWDTPAQACPMCSESLPSNSPGQDSGDAAAVSSNQTGSGLAEGFYYSILLMLAMPFLMVAGLGGMLYLSAKRASNGPPVPACAD